MSKTLKETSIEIYGDLRNGNLEVEVDYEYKINNFTFKIGKRPLITLDKLKQQLNIQGDIKSAIYTINNLPSTLNFVGVEQAKAKKTSIDDYGNLKTEKISFDYKNEKFIYQIGKNNKEMLIDELNEQIKKQDHTINPIIRLDHNEGFIFDLMSKDLTFENIQKFPNIDKTSLINAKIKAKTSSINKYGNLKTETIKFDHKKNAFIFQVGNKKILTLDKLNKQLNNQGDTETVDYTIKDIENFSNIDKTSLANAKIKEKINSFQKYGDLTTDLIISFVGRGYENFNFNVEGRSKNKLNISELNIEYEKQTGQDLKLTDIESVEKSKINLDPKSFSRVKKKIIPWGFFKKKSMIPEQIEPKTNIPVDDSFYMIFGIAFGVIVLISVILVCFWKIFKKKTKNKKNINTKKNTKKEIKKNKKNKENKENN